MRRGCNKAQQCGAPTKGHILHPRELAQFRGHELAALAAGHRHSAAVLDNGQVHSWGRNSSGQLGLGIGGDDAQPQGVTAFDGSPRVRSAALGYQHSLFVDISGSLWGAGDNSRGQLGLGTLIQGAWAETPQPMQPMPVFLVKSELKQRVRAFTTCLLHLKYEHSLLLYLKYEHFRVLYCFISNKIISW